MPEDIEDAEEYEYITAVVDCGNLHWEYKVKGRNMGALMSHDEDVELWSEKDITDLTMTMLDVPPHQRALIKIEYA